MAGNCVLTRVWQLKMSPIWGHVCLCSKAQGLCRELYPTLLKLTFWKTCWSVNSENHTSPNIFIFKTCHVYLDTGSNIYIYIYLRELSVAHKVLKSPFSFSIICVVVMFQHVEKECLDMYFSLTLFRKHLLTSTKDLHCRNDNRINS